MKNDLTIQKVREHLERLDKDVKHQMSVMNMPLSSIIGEYNRLFTMVDSSTQSIPENIIIRSDRVFEDIQCEWIYPANSETDHRILYIHGGSWCNADIKSYRPFAARIAKSSGYSVFLINYRVAPENPFPAGLSDCLASYTKMLVEGPEGEGKALKTFVAGNSTGANMSLALLFLIKERKLLLPSAVALLSPVTNCDFIEENKNINTFNSIPALKECLSSYLLKSADTKQPLVSPVYGDLNGLPDILVQVSEVETVFDDVITFVKKAKESRLNIELQTWADMPHDFQRFAPFLPQANDAIDKICNFLKKYQEKKVISFPSGVKINKKHISS